ncbi:flavodoxin family protein [Clostridiisalibacter paucivorans]|uniref:flavodoxin family protein n=1 Tax=Clostridiisalibacter paucivorans TaxID=408753 RepID=UPI00047DD093|nr:flavodoxin family protein [Clostridiisalibacter paucivorans]
MLNNVTLYISSCTGNTQKLAQAIQTRLQHFSYQLTVQKSSKSNALSKDDDLIILCFWCRKSTLDSRSKKIIDMCQNRKILAFGTMGSYPNSTYGQTVKSNVFDYISKNNQCLGIFLSQGKIPPERTQKRRKLPPDHPHFLDETGVERHLASRIHPDVKDLQNAVNFLEHTLKKYYAYPISIAVSTCIDGEPCIKCGLCSSV